MDFNNQELERREGMMQRDVLLVATVGASLLNGMHFSPVFDPAAILLKPFVAAMISSPLLLYYLTSMFISIVTLLIAGIPAALYERANGFKDSPPMSLGIWLAGVLALVALPHWLIG